MEGYLWCGFCINQPYSWSFLFVKHIFYCLVPAYWLHSIPIRVRRKRQRLPPNILIQNGSDYILLRLLRLRTEPFPIKASGYKGFRIIESRWIAAIQRSWAMLFRISTLRYSRFVAIISQPVAGTITMPLKPRGYTTYHGWCKRNAVPAASSSTIPNPNTTQWTANTTDLYRPFLAKSLRAAVTASSERNESQFDEIDRSELIEQLVLALLDKDKAFKKWMKQVCNSNLPQKEELEMFEQESNVESIQAVREG